MAYLTVEELRQMAGGDAALPPADYPDPRLASAIALAIAFIERATRQFFVERSATVLLDGTDSDTLHLAVPIIGVDSLFVNNSPNPTDPSLWRAYTNRTAYPDDRRNPRIKLISQFESPDIFAEPISVGVWKFRKGRQNQRIVGRFGYTEEDGSTPLLINRAIALVALEKLGALVSGGGPPAPPIPAVVGAIVEEWTDGHKYKLGVGDRAGRPIALSGISSSAEVEDIIKLYRAPISMATPASWSWS